ncbi:antibiotic biosynthesis monooxygenase [Grimontia sp. SpTr1]|uniref:antibiotic biosynthesis monooxygenase family protein n=1 Tax=Grimontia sp. SpTr1 TaxID=2995319 RepID=UPI00248B8709|nr:antibiotic biosynthesis monooxygenase [Grimontia sp. SpTr1]
MILEVAILNVVPGQEAAFENAFEKAQAIISAQKGYISHEVRRCMEQKSRYILLVNWETLEDHTEGFRQSEGYQDWKALLHHFYDPFPTVEHYESVPNLRNTNGA